MEWQDSNAADAHVDIDAEVDDEPDVPAETSANSLLLGQLDCHWKKVSESPVLCTND